MIGLGIGLAAPGRRHDSGAPSFAAQFQSVNASGWSVTRADPPTLAPDVTPEYFTVRRAGYNSAAQVVEHLKDLISTKRIRQAHPNFASLTTDQVALSDYIYSTDSITGVTNNSIETSPRPICNWALPDGDIVGNTLTAEVVAFHRNAQNGEQVAAVEFIVSDGTTTVTQIVSASVVSGRAGDKAAVIVYRGNIDVSSLANPATLTLNAKVYPHIGGVTAVADSSLNSGTRGFIPRKYRRDTARATAPYYVYVNASTGNNATGAVSTGVATAEAAPCQTIAGAILRAVAVVGDTAGVIIRLMAGSHALANTGISVTQAQTGGELVITRDPNAARSAVIVQHPLITWRPRLGAAGGQVRFKDVTFTRTVSGGDFTGEAASFLKVVFENVAYGNGGFSSSIIAANAGIVWLDTTITGGASSFWTAGLRDHISWRGCDAAVIGPEGFLVLGCNFTGLTGFSYGAKDPSGTIIAFNKLQGSMLFSMSGANRSQIAIVQNEMEVIATGAVQLVQFVGTTTLRHVLLIHNTFTGFFTVGRNNLFYDETATPCTTSMVSCHGNIHPQINTKGDRFDSNGALVGNWAYLYGVGCQGEFSMFIDAQSGGIGGTFAQAYPGLGASIGTSATVRNDPLFTAYAGVTSGPTAGAGGGDYSLQPGSPAKARVKPVLKYDLFGAARSLVLASAGACE